MGLLRRWQCPSRGRPQPPAFCWPYGWLRPCRCSTSRPCDGSSLPRRAACRSSSLYSRSPAWPGAMPPCSSACTAWRRFFGFWRSRFCWLNFVARPVDNGSASDFCSRPQPCSRPRSRWSRSEFSTADRPECRSRIIFRRAAPLCCAVLHLSIMRWTACAMAAAVWRAAPQFWPSCSSPMLRTSSPAAPR